MKEWLITDKDSGSTLSAFLKQQYGDRFSQKLLKLAIERGACHLNGRVERFASTRIGLGDKVIFEDQFFDVPLVKEGFDQSKILYEDSYLMAYNKPPGIATESLVDQLRRSYCDSVAPVHRLDKDTSGAILFAKGKESAKILEGLFRKREIQKTYLAVVDGVVSQNQGICRNFLGKLTSYHGQTLWGEVEPSKGVLAETFWECLFRAKDATLVRCKPSTGRTHQIRVHLAGLGHPILGDYQYGKVFVCSLKPVRLMLHAVGLNFAFPKSKKPIAIQAFLPDDFIVALQALKITNPI